MQNRLVGAAIVSAVFAVPGASAGLATSISPTADGDVQFSGSLGYSVDDTSESNRTLRSGGSNVRHSVYEFSLASLPAGSTITGATLRVQTSGVLSNTGSTADVFFFAYEGDGTVTDNDHGQLTAATQVADETFGTGAANPVGTVLDIDFDDLAPLQDALDNGGDFLTVRSETVNFVNFQVHSIDTNNSTAQQPVLLVTYIPAPGSLALLGLAGLAAHRRR